MRIAFRLAFAAGLLLLTALPQLRAQAKFDDGKGAFKTGEYRNVLAEAGYKPEEIRARIDKAYQQLFHGNPKTESIAFQAGSNANGPLMFVTDWANNDVRTEGMSYAMMIAVQLGKQSDFDAIWNWATTYMYVSDPKAPSYEYFAWSCKTDGTHNSEGAAPDGESYFAMALLFAANRWPGGHGIYDYQAQADKLLRAMVHRKMISAQGKMGTHTAGPMMNAEPPEILFVPDVMPDGFFTDPSYHLPAFYELWARWGPKEDSAFWLRAAETSRKFFVQTTNPQTGLAPVYANFDGTPHKNGFSQSDQFGYDAWRTASNWSVDWSWWRKATVEPGLSDRIQKFFESQGIDAYGPVYMLDGKEFGSAKDHPAGLVGTNAVAGLAATDHERAMKFVHALWNTPTPTGEYRYYDGMLYMMSLMHLGGEFRIWKPAAAKH